MSARYGVGEHVRVQLDASIVEVYDDGTLMLAAGGAARPVINPGGYGVTVTRRAPAEWPPQPGDVWEDAAGFEWFARRGNSPLGWMVSVENSDSSKSSKDLLDEHGPLTLVRRKGWTPTPAAVEQADEPVDERAAHIAGLRELADYAEANPDLPLDRYTFEAQYFVSNHVRDEADGYDHLHTIAELLGEKPFLPEDPIARHPNVIKKFSGGVRYEAVMVVSSLRKRAAAVEPPLAVEQDPDALDQLGVAATDPGEHYDGPCMDPQCGDSTWDHECPLPPVDGGWWVTNGVTHRGEPDADGDLTAAPDDATSGSGLAT